MNFWDKLPKPFFILAPMEDVTDTVFRQIVAKAAAPDAFFTEFTSTDGLMSKGYQKTAMRFRYTETERPLVAQIWGNNPKNYYKTAQMIVKMGFDGIDINLGCPVVAKDACIGLIHNPKLVKEIIAATKEGAAHLPISVKTRLGYNTIKTDEWIGFLLEQNLSTLAIHGRTRNEMSKVPAHWDEIQKAVNIRNQMTIKTLIIGNGDVKDRADALRKVKDYGVDGVMIGRGIFSNLWAFEKIPNNHSFQEKLTLLLEHVELFFHTWGKTKNFDILKKFYKIYISDIPNASDIRIQLMALKAPNETIDYIKKLLREYPN